MIGPHFSDNLIPVGFAFSVQVLIARLIRARGHDRHPEVISIGTDGIEGLLEKDFDFESEAIETKDVHRQQGQVRSHKDFKTVLWVDG